MPISPIATGRRALRVCPVLTIPGSDPARQFNIEFRCRRRTSPYWPWAHWWAGVEGIAKAFAAARPRDVAAMPAESRRGEHRRCPGFAGRALDLLEATPEANDWFRRSFLTHICATSGPIAMVADLTEEEKCARYAESSEENGLAGGASTASITAWFFRRTIRAQSKVVKSKSPGHALGEKPAPNFPQQALERNGTGAAGASRYAASPFSAKPAIRQRHHATVAAQRRPVALPGVGHAAVGETGDVIAPRYGTSLSPYGRCIDRRGNQSQNPRCRCSRR